MWYAIATFRRTGPIKTFSDLAGAQVHNARTKPIPHGIPGRPEPEHLIGSGDLVADVKRILVEHGVDPGRMRKNGVIAYEAVLTASHDFFEQGDTAAQAERLRAWKVAQVAFARARYGDHRIASMVLHQDEETPHIHLVVLPLEQVDDQRRKDRSMRWSLVGRSISGPGMFDKLQDDYAAAMAPFGLCRGVRHSGQKNEPPGRFMRRLAEQQAALDHDRAALDAEQRAFKWKGFEFAGEMMTERSALDRDRAAAAREAERVAQGQAEQERSLKRFAQQLRDDAEDLDRREAALEQAVEKLARERRAFNDDRAATTATKKHLAAALETAARFEQIMARIKGRMVPPDFVSAFHAAKRLRDEAGVGETIVVARAMPSHFHPTTPAQVGRMM